GAARLRHRSRSRVALAGMPGRAGRAGGAWAGLPATERMAGARRVAGCIPRSGPMALGGGGRAATPLAPALLLRARRDADGGRPWTTTRAGHAGLPDRRRARIGNAARRRCNRRGFAARTVARVADALCARPFGPRPRTRAAR